MTTRIPVRLPGKQAKYRARPVTIDGYRFDSQKEAKRYQELKILGVTGLVVHPVFHIIVNGHDICTYEADFSYDSTFEGGKRITEDCKGVRTPVYRIKKKLMKAVRGIEIMET